MPKENGIKMVKDVMQEWMKQTWIRVLENQTLIITWFITKIEFNFTFRVEKKTSECHSSTVQKSTTSRRVFSTSMLLLVNVSMTILYDCQNVSIVVVTQEMIL